MKYVCLVHFPPEAVESLEPEALRTLQAESLAYDEELARGGHLLTAHALQSCSMRATRRRRASV